MHTLRTLSKTVFNLLRYCCLLVCNSVEAPLCARRTDWFYHSLLQEHDGHRMHYPCRLSMLKALVVMFAGICTTFSCKIVSQLSRSRFFCNRWIWCSVFQMIQCEYFWIILRGSQCVQPRRHRTSTLFSIPRVSPDSGNINIISEFINLQFNIDGMSFVWSTVNPIYYSSKK